MKAFTPAQLAYLQSGRRLGRLATADRNGRPHVTPVGMWSFNEDRGTIDVRGHNLAATKKYRNVGANAQTAFVVDDLASTDPWHPRAVIVEGPAETIAVGEDVVIRITPDKIISWGVEG